MPRKSSRSGRKLLKDKEDESSQEVPLKKHTIVASMKGNLKMTLSSIPSRQHREKRVGRPPGGKRLAVKEMPGKLRTAFRRSLDPCDNSNDSGLGFDHHTDTRYSMGVSDRLAWPNSEAKRARIDVKVENDEDNDSYNFPEMIRTSKESTTLIRNTSSNSVPSLGLSNNQNGSSGRSISRCVPISTRHTTTSTPITLTTQLSPNSKYSDAFLTIVKQPEQQHRARYQTEGSRGAVKDREGNGFPIVHLSGYIKPATLQVFIGTDIGKVSPHMFYQACKVSGKNSTPCIERKVDGTCVIELQLDPSKDMSATCDCVGILKERNVDVEHRFPDQLGNRSKKKSTKCRMIFRANIVHEDGKQETLQVCSQPIVCTQPPGVPEISKKSLTSCPASGGLELFVLGKNFSKDTKVYFQQVDEDRLVCWKQACVPDKEYLQQTHFVCVVPPYRRPNISEPVSVRLFVVASGKTSESHQFVYTPVNGAVSSVPADVPQQSPFFNKMSWPASLSKRDQDLSIMPPPDTSMVPLSSRRPSLSISQSNELHSPPLHTLKQEFIDENSQSSIIDSSEICHERYRHISESSLDVHHGDSNLSMMNENSMDIHHSNITNDSILHHENSNLSISDNSVEMIVRRNSLSRPMSSMHENLINANIASPSLVIHDENSVMHCSVPKNQTLMNTNAILQLSPSNCSEEVDELKVIDLRMKMPMATVADLASTSAPSMATLQNFGVTVASLGPLPAQSAQSVENFLTNIESKASTTNSLLTNMSFKEERIANNMSDPTFLNTQQQTFPMANNTMNIFTKTDRLEDQNKSPIFPTTLPSSFNPERLDAFLSSVAGQTINTSINRSDVVKDNLSIAPSDNNHTNVLIPPQPSSMMVPQVLNSPDGNSNHVSSNISPDVILNSPNIICQTPANEMLQCPSGIDGNLNASPVSSQGMNISSPLPDQLSLVEPEKAVLLEAAVDLLQTQKKISELECLSAENKEPTMNKMYMNNYCISNANNNETKSISNETFNNTAPQNPVEKNDFIIPISVKEIQLTNSTTANVTEKKIEGRMSPQELTSFTENELIDFINPSCFDQGNNNYVQIQ